MGADQVKLDNRQQIRFTKPFTSGDELKLGGTVTALI